MLFRASPDRYTTIPTRTAVGTLSMIRALVVAAAADPKGPVKVRLAKMLAAGEHLQATWLAANDPSATPLGLRSYDLRVDRGWRVMRARLSHWVEIDHDEWSERAAELLAQLYPNGLDFLSRKYLDQWSEGDLRFKRIEEDGLEDDLKLLVGEAFADELREAQEEYGEVLGITAQQTGSQERVIDALRAARRAIASYARLVYALTDEEDGEAVAATEEQLEPILRFRESRSASEEQQDVEDMALPLPELPEEAGEDEAA